MKQVKLVWSVFLTALLVANLCDRHSRATLREVFARLTFETMLQNCLVAIGAITVFWIMYKWLPAVRWSWHSLRPQAAKDWNQRLPANINLLPMENGWWGLAFLVLFALNVPFIVGWEECVFRDGTLTWSEGAARSLLFGFMHCLFGVPLAAGLACSLVGLWFTHQYFSGGIMFAAVNHTAYDLILLGGLFISRAYWLFLYARSRFANNETMDCRANQ